MFRVALIFRLTLTCLHEKMVLAVEALGLALFVQKDTQG